MLNNFDFEGPIVDWLDAYSQRGYMTTDASLVIRGWNKWLENKSGLPAEEVVGRQLFEVFPDMLARQLDRFYKEALLGQVSVVAHRFHKYLIRIPAGPESDLSEMQQSALIGPLLRKGQLVGTITVIDDVSERVLRENELYAAREEAMKANEAKDRFLAVLSHDLRTPLTAIMGWARAFRQHLRDERMVLKGSEVIERNARIQLELLEQVLDISRISSAKLELKTDTVNVLETTIMALETLDPIAEAKGIRIDREMPSDERQTLLDSKRFQQVIWNLISNAVKFTPTSGWVRVTLVYEDDGFRLSIADSGKGISAESLPHVFEPLWQAKESAGHGGLGLGLAIVKNIVELHGGSIRVHSSGPGQGAVFIVQFPWSVADAREAQESHGNFRAM